jgi:hypothetical protein
MSLDDDGEFAVIPPHLLLCNIVLIRPRLVLCHSLLLAESVRKGFQHA